MSDMKSNPLEDAGLHRHLTSEERTRIQTLLAANPDSCELWTADLNLNRLLRDLPVKPVATNFTLQVLDATRHLTPPVTQYGWLDWLRQFHRLRPISLAPKLALITLVLGTGFLFYRQHQIQVRMQVAHSVARVTDIASLLDPAVIQDFEVISRLGEVPSQVDEDLLLALK